MSFNSFPHNPTVRAVTGTTDTILASDNGNIVTYDNGSSISVTVPAGLPTPFTCMVIQIGAGQVTLAGSGATLNNANGLLTANQYSTVSLIGYTTNTYVVGGDTTT